MPPDKLPLPPFGPIPVRVLRREETPEPGEIPVASFGDRHSSSLMNALSSQLPSSSFSQTQEAATPSPPSATLSMSQDATGTELTLNDTPTDASQHAAPDAPNLTPPPPAQRRVDWADVTFPNLVLPPPPSTVPSRVASQTFSFTPTMSTEPPPLPHSDNMPMSRTIAVPPSGALKATTKARKRGRNTPPPGAGSGRERRRKIDPSTRRNAGVGTRGLSQQSLTCFAPQDEQSSAVSTLTPQQTFAMVPTLALESQTVPTTAAQALRTLPEPHLSDSDYLDIVRPPADPALLGAPASDDMVIDAPASPGRGAVAGPLHVNSEASLNIPIQSVAQGDVFTFHFDAHTPRQQYDTFARPSAQLPPRSLPPPPIGGPYAVRDIQPRPLEDQGTANRLPSIEEFDRQVAERHRRDNEERVYGLATASSVTPAQEGRLAQGLENRENVPVTRDSETNAPVSASRIPIPVPCSSTPVPRETPLPIYTLHPMGGAQLQGNLQYRAYGQPPARTPRNLQRMGVQPEMPVPRGGFPEIRYDDPDSVTLGSDQDFVDAVRCSDDNTVILHFPLLLGVPPERLRADVMDRTYDSVRGITGESEFFVVPPRPSRIPVPGAPASAWFLRGLTAAGADMMIQRRFVSTPLVTYSVHELTPDPQVILVLTGFATNIGTQIATMIRTTFESAEVRHILAQHVALNPMFSGMPPNDAVDYLLETVSVDVSTHSDRTIAARVYMQSPAIDVDAWRYLRESIARVVFEDGLNSPAVPTLYRCDICAGSDHPSHACPYPGLPGYLGPVLRPEPAREAPPQPGSSLIFRQRESREMCNANANGNGNGSGNSNGKQRKARGPFYPPGEGPPFNHGHNGRGGGPGAAGGSGGSGLSVF
ncbi:hypothetical protein C8T65DRAFT_693369 [Cerioporus squamosus]|nr:hypothetical protein C8T65DRAFT_693369 [Cerioporus squamosus]